MNELVSVIIPVHRKEKAETCLAHLKNQTYFNIEAITVDGEGFPAVKRNIGLKKSHGSLVLFLDDDEYMTSNLISACVQKFQENFDMVGYRQKVPVQKRWLQKCLSLYQAEDGGVKVGFYKKQVLDKIGLLDETLFLCDDIDLFQRAVNAGYKYDVVACEDGYVTHDFNMSLHDRVKKTVWSRRAYRHMLRKDGVNLDVWKVNSRRRILREMVDDPKLVLGTVFVGFLFFVLRRIP